MHQYNFIQWLCVGAFVDDDPLASEYDRMFIDTPGYIPHYDAMGLVLMGGEL